MKSERGSDWGGKKKTWVLAKKKKDGKEKLKNIFSALSEKNEMIH